jgi:FMN-dependent NADH-azoreductase
MTTLLRIDSSSRFAGSHSRDLGDTLEAHWLHRYPGSTVVRRDLAANPVRHITDLTIAGFYTQVDQHSPDIQRDVVLSDDLIAELMAADALLVTAPIYNFSIPSALKAWIDHIVRINHTFSYDGAAFTGLVTGKPVYIACAYGASGYNGGPLAAYDLLKNYLDLLFRFLGFTDVHFVTVEATTADPQTVAAHLAGARLLAASTIASSGECSR